MSWIKGLVIILCFLLSSCEMASSQGLVSRSFSWQLTGQEKKEAGETFAEGLWQVKIKNAAPEIRFVRPIFIIRGADNSILGEDRLDLELTLAPGEEKPIKRSIWILKPDTTTTLKGELSFEVRGLSEQTQTPQEEALPFRTELPGRIELNRE